MMEMPMQFEMEMELDLETGIGMGMGMSAGAGTAQESKMQAVQQMDIDVQLDVELEKKVENLTTSVAEVDINQKKSTNAAATESNEVETQKPQTIPTAVEKLVRYCYIGNFDAPIYKPPSLDLLVENYLSSVLELCTQVSQKELIDCLIEVLHRKNSNKLPRRDEALFVLAVYLSTCKDETERTLARGQFALMVTGGKDLLLFVKLVKRIQSMLKRKTIFSRTVRKAVIEWYKLQPLERLLDLWMQADCEYCTHRDLLYHCHYTNEKFESDIEAALRLLFTPAKEVILWPECLDPLNDFQDLIVGVAKMRLAEKPEVALPLVQQLSLGFQHVPRNLMSEPKLVKFLLNNMNYDQMVQSWFRFLNVFKVHRSDKRNYIGMFFKESKLREADISPVRFLVQDARHIKRERNSAKGPVPKVQPSFMYKVFKHSFGLNKALGLRFHITINLELCYINKYLNGRWRSISYLDALLAFAFGYYKTEPQANVQIWFDRSGKLKPLPWTQKMTLDEAKKCCQMQKVAKIKQSLTDVLDNAQNDTTRTYDVFLVLVPSGTRGNPKNNSDELHHRLGEYRQHRNPNAKFIIMTLRENHGSMTYSMKRREHILELCGLSDQMPQIINAFANDKFI